MIMSVLESAKEDILLSCRYGDIEDVQAFMKEFGTASLAEIRDQCGNSILHMISANGHIELLDYVLPLVPSSLLAAQNDSGSTALHWAALNMQLEVVNRLILHPNGPGRDLIDIKNKYGRSSLSEAEFAGWDEGAKWFVEMMNLDMEPQDDIANLGDEAENHPVEVEIQDADGQVASFTVTGSASEAIGKNMVR